MAGEHIIKHNNGIIIDGTGDGASPDTGIILKSYIFQYTSGSTRVIEYSTSNTLQLRANTIVTGSLVVNGGSGVELQVASTGVNIGSISTDTHTTIGTQTISGSILFAPSASSFNGEIVRFGAGTLTTGQLYFLSSSGTWSLANANSTGSSTGMLGLAVGSSPTANGLLIRGFAASSSYTYGTTGSVIYMATSSGAMTATSPSSSNHVVRVMGYRTTLANTIYFDPDKTWVTLA